MKDITTELIEKIGAEIDSENFLENAFKLHEQIEKILEYDKEKWDIKPFPQKPANMLLMGLGGSAIGGDLLRNILADELTIPTYMCRNYNVPGFVGKDTLCICASYSGNTEETLSAYQECRERGAKIVAVSTGGKLEDMALRDGALFCPIPPGYQPRAALGISFTAQLVILMRLGLIKDYTPELKSTADMLRDTSSRWKNRKTMEENPPLKLAAELTDKIPVIYGVSGWTSIMAYRWKCQFNENAKKYAISGEFPELNHNEIVGWEGNEDFYKDMHVILLRNDTDHPRTRVRMDLTAGIIREKSPVSEINGKGANKIEKLFYLVLFGDLMTIYLAYLNRRDPADINVIHRLKAELAKI